MKDFNLRTMLRNRLPIAKSKDFLSWAKSVHPDLDLHHILGSNKVKLNDFLVCPMAHENHMKIENGIEVEGYSFEEQLMFAIDLLIVYTKYLEVLNEH